MVTLDTSDHQAESLWSLRDELNKDLPQRRMQADSGTILSLWSALVDKRSPELGTDNMEERG